MQRANGFTIVELLVVIVVVAILAALSYVGYTGIANRASDSVVQQDLASLAQQLRLIYVEKDEYPQGGRVIDAAGAATGHHANPPGDLTFSVSKSAYLEDTGSGSANFVYCTGKVQGGEGHVFGLAAVSKSGNRISHTSGAGLTLHGGYTSLNTLACSGIEDPRSHSSGYSINQGGWQSWTD